MTIRLVRKLTCMKDLFLVEKCIRAMYHTADGASCQALNTMEYQCWRNNVIRQILFQSKQEEANTQQEHIKFEENMELLCQMPDSVQAFLCGLKIVNAKNICLISQLLPAMCEEKFHKQRCSNHDMQSRQEDCTNVFKKSKICHSPRQV
jgi:hypothetical protein